MIDHRHPLGSSLSASREKSQINRDDAFARLVRRYSRLVQHEVMGWTLDRDLQDDLVQETWILVWSKISQFVGRLGEGWTTFENDENAARALGVWIRRVCQTACGHNLRRLEGTQLPYQAASELPAGDSAAIDLASTEFDNDAVWDAVLKLPPRQRETFLLRICWGYSTKRSADALACQPGTIQASLHAAVRALRQRLLGNPTAASR